MTSPASPTTRPLAVVTGASSGIGLELARQLAEHGFDLVVAAGSTGIATAAVELAEAGGQVEPVQVDLATYEGVEQLCAAVVATGRPVEALAINAGIGAGGDFTRETDLDDELRVIALNVVSAVHLAKRLLPAMVTRGSGRVLFTSSQVSTMPGALQAVYAASKSFVQSLSEALREELKDTGVTVTALMPGATDTNFFHRAKMDHTRVGSAPKDDPAKVAQQGFDAMMAGEEKVMAGSLLTRAQTAAAKVLPDRLKAAMHHKIAGPRPGGE